MLFSHRTINYHWFNNNEHIILIKINHQEYFVFFQNKINFLFIIFVLGHSVTFRRVFTKYHS
jgi:hypothetical protein